MKIVFFGDSITDMGRNRESVDEIYTYGNGYPVFVASALYRKDPLKYQVINRGISGDRSVDLYARIKRDVWNEHPDVLSILIGVNDVWHEINCKNGVEPKRYEKIYDMMLEETRERLPNVKLVLCEPFVLKGRDTAAQFDKFTELYAYADIVKSLSLKYHAHFLPLQQKLNVASAKFGVEKYLYDGIHPNVAGATLIADAWLELFEEKIERLN